MKDECCANCRFLRISGGNVPWVTKYSCTADVRIEPLGVFDNYTGRDYNAAWTDLENRVCGRYRSEKETTRKLSEMSGILDDSLERIADELEGAGNWCDQNGDYGTGIASISEQKLREWSDRIRRLAKREVTL